MAHFLALDADSKSAAPGVLAGMRLAASGAVAAIALATAPALADVKAGVDAWSSGDFTTAVEQWRGPAGRGDADAMFNLAQAYRLGRGVEIDVERARTLYAEAARKGHVKAADNYGLLLFQQGEQSEAMPLVTAAAERGDPRAQYILGLAHFNGDYAPKDWVRAYALLTLSVSAGLPQAKDAVAQMDRYVPIEQRQMAQSVARDLEAEAVKLRAAQLADAELNRLPSSAQPAPRIAQTTPVPASSEPRVNTNFSLNGPAAASTTAPAAAAPTRVTPPAPRRAATGTGPWRVQLGAFGVAGNADRLWKKLSGSSALSGARKILVPAGRVTRLQAGGFASRASAQKACSALKAQGQGCLVTKK